MSLRDGAIAPWARSTSPYYMQTLEALARHYKFSTDDALGRAAGEGAEGRSSTAPATRRSRFVYDDGLRTYEVKKPFEGVIANLERRWKETESDWVREEIERYMSRDAVRGLQAATA